jgi:predicted esterase
MTKLLNHLLTDCTWLPSQIHLFGFAQGGSVAAEFALNYSNLHPDANLGSVVCVGGPLLSFPTLTKPCQTPILVFHRPPPSESALPSRALTAFKKGFGAVEEVKMEGEGMPRSTGEWRPIMKFWSERLGRRVGEGVYEVISGKGPD